MYQSLRRQHPDLKATASSLAESNEEPSENGDDEDNGTAKRGVKRKRDVDEWWEEIGRSYKKYVQYSAYHHYITFLLRLLRFWVYSKRPSPLQYIFSCFGRRIQRCTQIRPQFESIKAAIILQYSLHVILGSFPIKMTWSRCGTQKRWSNPA